MNGFTKYPHVFSPLKLAKRVTAKNRIEIPPMGINLGRSDGYVTAEYYLWVKRLAKSGAGIVTVSDAGIDFELSGGNIAGPRADSEDKIPGLSRLADEIHRYHGVASIELTHYGVVANPVLVRPRSAMNVSSSDIFWNVDGKKTQVAREMTREEIHTAIDHYCRAAVICKQAGFDMIMVHGAHGQLPTQFLSPHFNKRTDEYGGSEENRQRFPLELLQHLRKALGPDFPIEYRISGDEIEKDGLRIEDNLRFLEKAQKYINMVHFSVGIDPAAHGRFFSPCYLEPHNRNHKFAAAAKKVLSIPVAVVGGISYHADAEKMIADGETDVVAMGRATICDPEMHRKAELGLDDQIRPCMRCGNCGRVSRQMGLKTVLCSLNPTAGRELEYFDITPAPHKKHVMIVGGGFAGMQAAITARQRGHEVDLYEASDRLGGLGNVATALPFKSDLRKSLDYFERMTKESGANIHFDVKVTPDLVRKVQPDGLIIATGARPFVPPIKGVDLPNVVWAGDIDTGHVKAGKQVVIIGAGLTGIESAIELAKDGHTVTLMDVLPRERWCAEANPNNQLSLFYLLDKYKVHLMPEAGVDHIEADKVFVKDTDGNMQQVPADTVAMATGMRSKDDVVEALSGIVRYTWVVGDSQRSGNIMKAVHEGFQAAVDI